MTIESYDENSKIVFGDTEYFFSYLGDTQPRVLYVYATLSAPVTLHPEIGHSYETVGLEINVVNMSSNELSVKIKPTVENYMFSTYHDTRVEIPCEQSAPDGQNSSVKVSLVGSGNKTRQYTFEYPFASGTIQNATLIVGDSSRSKQYEAAVGFGVPQAEYDFGILITIYQANSNFMVIYVRPLY